MTQGRLELGCFLGGRFSNQWTKIERTDWATIRRLAIIWQIDGWGPGIHVDLLRLSQRARGARVQDIGKDKIGLCC